MNPKDFTRIVRDRGDPIEADVAADIIDDLADQGEALEKQLAQARSDLAAAVADRNTATARLQAVDEQLCGALNDRDALRAELAKANDRNSKRTYDAVMELHRKSQQEARDALTAAADAQADARKARDEADQLGVQVTAQADRLRLADALAMSLLRMQVNEDDDARREVWRRLREFRAVPGDVLASGKVTPEPTTAQLVEVDAILRAHRSPVYVRTMADLDVVRACLKKRDHEVSDFGTAVMAMGVFFGCVEASVVVHAGGAA